MRVLFSFEFTLHRFVSLTFVNCWIFQLEAGCPFCGVQQNYLQNIDKCESSKHLIRFSDKSTKPNCFKTANFYFKNDGIWRISPLCISLSLGGGTISLKNLALIQRTQEGKGEFL
jgi:hypothetical protein